MQKLKLEDYRILFALMQNARISDRQLANILGTSQPTISRRRVFVEKELIDGYTAVPKWEKLGYEIFAITFFKIKASDATKEKYQVVRKKGTEWLMTQPNVIMAGSCRGMGMDAFSLSLHKSYADYDDWFGNVRLDVGDLIDDVQSVFVNIRGKELLKPLHFKYVAEKR